MKKNSRRLLFIGVGFLLLAMLVVTIAVASVFVYRQFAERDRLTVSFLSGETQVDSLVEDQRGVLVTAVDPNSPAADAGLKRGSVILAVNGQAVNSPRELQDAIREHQAGDAIVLSILNGEEQEEVEATLGSAGPYLGIDVAGSQGGPRRDFFGAVPELPPRFFSPETPFGPEIPGFPRDLRDPFSQEAFVVSVVPGSPADEAGVQHADVITEIDGQSVEDRAQLSELIGQKEPGDEIEITVRRGEDTVALQVTLVARPEDAERGYLGVRLAPAFSRQFFFEEQSG